MNLSRHPRTPLLAAALALTMAVAGCSSGEDDEAPAACLTGSAAYLTALEAAPGEVRLEGETPISECLTSGQQGGELAQVGKEVIDAATVLNEEAREDPAGPAAVRLGYLVGAVERGAEGIHADLVRRLQSAANFSPDRQLPPAFERGFAEGYTAGRDGG
jgi:hypothetical protein